MLPLIMEAPILPVLLLAPIVIILCIRAHKADENKEHHRAQH